MIGKHPQNIRKIIASVQKIQPGTRFLSKDIAGPLGLTNRDVAKVLMWQPDIEQTGVRAGDGQSYWLKIAEVPA